MERNHKNTVIACSKLAEKNCANFLNGKCLGENRCPVYNGSISKGLRCPYFEESVLPSDEQLQENYQVHILKQSASYSSKKCKGCNRVFKTDNYRLQYCGDTCKGISNRNNKRLYASKSRKSAIKE
ncbi:cysteine-rich VLP protein [Peribacillus frigoritolerans]|uniref:cysteine-rich VLP protein n=1 Tax=Peribacillus frigoritolerans TaxID=450367 RepID=UPI0038710D71